MQPYTTRSGKTQYKQSLEAVEAAMLDDSSIGYCLACGAEASGVEPDARRYVCESCGAAKVYGAEELVVMGLVY